MTEQRPLTDLSLPAAKITTATQRAVRVYVDVPQLGAHPRHTTEHLPVMYDAAAKTYPGADIQDFVIALRHSEIMFTQRSSICLIIPYHRRLRKGLLQDGTDRERLRP